MKTQWTIIYYETPTGKCPIKGWIEARSVKHQARLHALLSLVEERGPDVPPPYLTRCAEDIYEIQVLLAGKQTRLFYGFGHERDMVLTHGLNQTPTRQRRFEIRQAQKYHDAFMQGGRSKGQPWKSFRMQHDFVRHNPLFRRLYNQERQIFTLALQVIHIRQRSGLTQIELAKRAHIKTQQLVKLEWGLNADMHTFVKICEALEFECKLQTF